MKTIDRYIIRQFLINFLILLFVLFALIVLVDITVNFDEFFEAAQARQDQFGSVAVALVAVIFDFWGPLALLMYVYLSGLVVVAASGFTFAALVRSREIVALLTSGVSMYRIATPVLVVGGLLNLLTLADQELLIPPLAQKLLRSQSTLADARAGQFSVYYAADQQGRLLSAARYDPDQRILEGVSVLERDERGRAIRRITASQAVWDGDREVWELLNGLAVRVAQAPGEGGVPPAPEPVAELATSLTPRVLLARRATLYPRLLSIPELREMMASNPNPAELRQIIHSRLSLLVTNVLILAMGLPFFLLREPRMLLWQAVKASAVVIGAWGAAMVVLQVGTTQIPPVVSAWLPVVFFLPLSALMLQTVRS